MKIAFVGKGGSGKSTLSAQFTRFLQSKGLPFIAIDADINVHMGELLGVHINEEKALSLPLNVKHIRSFLKGNNKRILDLSHFVKTTPPAEGSKFVEIDSANEVINAFAIPIGAQQFLMHVGTYSKEEIGTACYHVNLSIFENILSHTKLKKNEWLVADMVAGTDAFSNTLHSQFDLIVLVVEPTPEGISVFKQYGHLAEKSGVLPHLIVVGNKVEDKRDQAYLKEHIGESLLGWIHATPKIKQARQQSSAIELELLEPNDIETFVRIFEQGKKRQADPKDRLKQLHNLHRKYIAQDYVIQTSGDISNQIDPHFEGV